MNKYCLALDLKDDLALINQYKAYHKKVWPEITESLIDSGIENAEIYYVGNRMFMILEVNDSFSFEKKDQMDNKNQKVQVWENLMWKYQQKLPWAKANEKWIIMDRIYQLKE